MLVKGKLESSLVGTEESSFNNPLFSYHHVKQQGKFCVNSSAIIHIL